jgi:hypothetical protein
MQLRFYSLTPATTTTTTRHCRRRFTPFRWVQVPSLQSFVAHLLLIHCVLAVAANTHSYSSFHPFQAAGYDIDPVLDMKNTKLLSRYEILRVMNSEPRGIMRIHEYDHKEFAKQSFVPAKGGQRIKIGFLSAEFSNKVTMYLMVRSRFEVFTCQIIACLL